MSYIGSKPANKPVVASDLDPVIITGQTALTDSPATTDELIISDAGTLKRIDFADLGATPAFSAKVASNLTSQSFNATILVPHATETFDTDGAFTNTASNYRFTVPSGKAGKYFITFNAGVKTESGAGLRTFGFFIRKDGTNVRSFYVQGGSDYTDNNADVKRCVTGVLDLAESEYIDTTVYCYGGSGSLTILADSFFEGFRIAGA